MALRLQHICNLLNTQSTSRLLRHISTALLAMSFDHSILQQSSSPSPSPRPPPSLPQLQPSRYSRSLSSPPHTLRFRSCRTLPPLSQLMPVPTVLPTASLLSPCNLSWSVAASTPSLQNRQYIIIFSLCRSDHVRLAAAPPRRPPGPRPHCTSNLVQKLN